MEERGYLRLRSLIKSNILSRKRSLSAVITTVLIILLVIACVLIVYVVVMNMIQRGVDDANISPVNVLLKASSSSLSSELVSVFVSRSAGEGELKGVKVVLKNSAGASVCTYENKTSGVKELETVVYVINKTKINCPPISNYDVYPIIKSGSKEIYGLKAVHSGEAIPTSITSGCSVAADCEDNNVCTTDSCSNGVCVNSPITSCLSVSDGCCPSGCTNANDGDCALTCTDADHDGYNVSATGCGLADCNDSNAAIKPSAIEICDGKDNDCDTIIDEGNLCSGGLLCISGSCSSILSNLAAYWKFDNNLLDSSGNGNNGFCSGSGCPTSVTGKVGSAYSFNGGGNFVQVTNTASLSPRTGNFSILVWFNTTWSGWWMDLVRNYGETNANNMYSITVWSDSKLSANYRDGNGNIVSVTGMGPVITDGNWHQAAWIRAGKKGILYLDGMYIGEMTNANLGDINTDMPCGMQIGRLQDRTCSAPTAYFYGSLDEILIFNRALSVSEIQAIYTANYNAAPLA